MSEQNGITDKYKVIIMDGNNVNVVNVHKRELSKLIESVLTEDKHILSVAPIYESV